jgi:hypothetical protein
MRIKKQLAAVQDLIALDQIQSTQGETPSGDHPNLLAYFHHFKEWDARKCEAQVLKGEIPPLLEIRALLFRGRHSEAESVIQQIKDFDDEKELAEVLLERVKLAALDGDWRLCLDLALSIRAKALVAISRLTLLQLEALALFELGQWDLSESCLERVESLATSFPNCTSVIYARILRIKIASRRKGAEFGLSELDAFWKELIAKEQLDLNLVQALMRLEIDLFRLAGRPHFEQAQAAILLAEAMGEKLYFALGKLDEFYAAPLECRSQFEREARDAAKEFKRVNALLKEVDEETEDCSSTARAILTYLGSSKKPKMNVLQENKHKFIFLARRGILISLQDGKCSSLELFPRIRQCLIAIGKHGPVSKREFFSHIWGKQKYVPHLHDDLIFSMQQRMRKKFGLKLASARSTLTVPFLLYIE